MPLLTKENKDGRRTTRTDRNGRSDPAGHGVRYVEDVAVKNTRGNVGPYNPHGNIFHKEYIGDDPTLRGKSALVGFAFVGGVVVAQFDDMECGYGAGWHQFKHSDFWPAGDEGGR